MASAASSDGEFYERAIERIQLFMISIGVGAAAFAWWLRGWPAAIGLVLGAIVSYINFYWLKQVVIDMTELAAQSGVPVSGRRVVFRFLIRYFLMAVVAFVILTVSRESLNGLFAGLCLPVAAMLCEAAYEGYVALVRGA